MSCKILDAGPGQATHYGHHLGSGVHIARDDDGNVVLCQHPVDDVRAAASLKLTLTPAQWSAAVAGMDTRPSRFAPKAPRKPRAPRARKAAKK